MPTLFLALSLFSFQDETADLIEKLRSENLDVRDTATKRLRELGKSARSALEKAAKDPDAELVARASYLLRILQLKDDLTPSLQTAVPDAVERLAKDGIHNWTIVFLEAVTADDQGNRKHQNLAREDLIPLAANAIRGAVTQEEKIRTCWVASNWRLKSALPEMRKFLADEDVHVRQMALVWYVVLGGREVAGKVAELLKDDSVEVRRHAANHLGSIGTKSQVADLQAALKDPDQVVQLNAAKALGNLGDRTAIPRILAFLDTDYRGDAAWALADLGCMEHVEKIAALLDGHRNLKWYGLIALDILDARDRAELVAKHIEDVNGPAAMILCNWKSRAHADRIGALVKNKEPGIYSGAILGLGAMGDARQAKVLVPILKDSLNYMRADAAKALELLDARDLAGDIAALLKDEDSHARSHGTLALGKLASRMADADRKGWIDAIRPLEKDVSEEVRFAASLSLLRLGAKGPLEQRDLVQRLDSTWFESWRATVGECTLALAEVHEKAGYAKLMCEVELKRSIESMDSLAAALQDAGLKLVNPEDLTLRGRMGAGRVIRPLDLLNSMVLALSGVIIEKDTLRVVPLGAVLDLWLKRLQGK